MVRRKRETEVEKGIPQQREYSYIPKIMKCKNDLTKLDEAEKWGLQR